MAGAFGAHGDNAGLAEHFEMVGKRGLGQIQTKFIAGPFTFSGQVNDS